MKRTAPGDLHSRTTSRRPCAAILAVSLGTVLAGCSSSSPPAGAAATAPATSSTPADATPAVTATGATPPSQVPTTTPAPTTTSPTGGGAAACPTRALGTKSGGSQGAAGSTYTTIDVTNISSTTCTLHGFPGVSFAGGTPVHQIGAAATQDPSQGEPLVTLTPGQVAHVQLKISNAANYPPSQCQPATATYLQIYPPNQTTPIYLGYTSPACAKPIHLLTVSAVQAGPA
ncbi:MAG: DUF4232 domain-containing protein [Actinomycetota bacterium]|nr:DUF4232 domain-containing protein [Actinomycetota bacterium]